MNSAVPTVKRANVQLHDLTYNRYFRSLPIVDVQAILEQNGLDGAVLDGIYAGREGTVREMLNAKVGVTFSWYKMPSGHYEIVSYVS